MKTSKKNDAIAETDSENKMWNYFNTESDSLREVGRTFLTTACAQSSTCDLLGDTRV